MISRCDTGGLGNSRRGSAGVQSRDIRLPHVELVCTDSQCGITKCEVSMDGVINKQV